MNVSDVAVFEELSEPEFTHHANSAGIFTSVFFQCYHSSQSLKSSANPALIGQTICLDSL